MLLTGGALRRLEAITPPGMRARLDVSLTDEPPLAQAIVDHHRPARGGGIGPQPPPAPPASALPPATLDLPRLGGLSRARLAPARLVMKSKFGQKTPR